MDKNLEYIFNPSSVAVIGATNNPLKWGNWISKSLIESGWKGDIYLINGRGGEVCGLKAYPTVTDVGSSVDLAIVGVPTPLVADVVQDCLNNNVKGIIIISAGFGEIGEEGKKLENKLVEMARRGGSRIVGPNCAGIYNAASDLNATIVSFLKGPLALISQSGNFGLNLNFFAKRRGLGFSKWISLGNQADIQFHEYLEYIRYDYNTRAVIMYMEAVKDGRKFLKVAKETTKVKPVVVLKAGVSSAGMRSAASHTGALASSNDVYDAAFRQSGVIRVNNSSELLNVGEALSKCALPAGNNIAILSDGGGDATLAADAAERFGLRVPLLSRETQAKLSQTIPAGAIHSVRNPVDFASEADLWCFVKCTEILLQDADINGVVICGGFGSYKDTFTGFENTEEQIAPKISHLQVEYKKPIILESNFLVEGPRSLKILSEQGVPVYGDVETAMKCMSCLMEYASYLARAEDKVSVLPPPATPGHYKAGLVIDQAEAIGRKVLVETEARVILKEYGLPVSDFRLATSQDEAARMADELGYPVVMKVVSPDIIHKSDAGGVRLNINSGEDVARLYEKIIDGAARYKPGANIYGVMITRMEPKGTEVIVGMIRDRVFGPTLMFGLGGIFVEVLKDVSFRIAPLTRNDAYDMISQIKGFPILKGVRGEKPKDIEALADMLVNVSAFVIENPRVQELDLNPVFAFEKGASVIDARIILTP